MTIEKEMPKLQKLLTSLDACESAIVWAGNKTPAQAWLQCPRGDWLLWIAVKAGVDHKTTVLAACDCAETALRYVPASWNFRPRIAIETARSWCRGEATIEQVRATADATSYAAHASYDSADAATRSAYAAEAAAEAAYAAAHASYASAGVNYHAADAAYAASHTADAAYTAAHAAYAARASYTPVHAAAYAAAHKALARIVRRRITWRDVMEASA